MSSPANWNNGEYLPSLPQANKDAAISNLRTAYPRATYPMLTSDVAWAMLRLNPGSPTFDPDDQRDRSYVMWNWKM